MELYIRVGEGANGRVKVSSHLRAVMLSGSIKRINKLQLVKTLVNSPPVTQFNKFLAFYGSRLFIPVFTTSLHCTPL
jgi:hypothetical protein